MVMGDQRGGVRRKATPISIVTVASIHVLGHVVNVRDRRGLHVRIVGIQLVKGSRFDGSSTKDPTSLLTSDIRQVDLTVRNKCGSVGRESWSRNLA